MNIDEKIAQDIKIYRKKLLDKVKGRVWNLFKDSPVEDQTSSEAAYEKGLSDACRVIESAKEEG